MRSLLTRAAAVVAVAFGVAFGAQGVAFADVHDDPIEVTNHGHAIEQNSVGNSGVLSGSNIFLPANLTAIVNDLNALVGIDKD